MQLVDAATPPTDDWSAPVLRGARTRHRRQRGRRRRWLTRLGIVALTLVVLAAVTFTVLWAVTPGVGDAEARIRAQVKAVGATDADLPVPAKVAAALVATEDSRFYSNPGIDFVAVPRAAAAAVGLGSQHGGATLEQQLAKMVYTPGSGGPAAIIEQGMLALKLDTQYSKTQILEMYLASAYFGHGFYGLAAASSGYFHLPPGQLDWGQASLLAGLVQAPSAYDPLAHYPLARSRQRHVLDRLVATGMLTSAQADAAFAAPLGLRP